MKTEDLVRILAEDTAAAASPLGRLARGLPVALALSVAAMWGILGPRADLGHALTTAVPLMRHVLTLGLFGLALALGWQQLRPEGRVSFWPLALVGVPALGLLAWGLWATPRDGWQMALEGKTQMVCLISIPLLSLPPVAAILLAFRQGASVRPAVAGAFAGLAGGGLGAAVYALHCIEDSPLFYVTWYGVAIAAVTAISALVGARVLRW